MVSPEPLEPKPKPTQQAVDLSGETIGPASDLQGAAAVPDEVVPQSIPPETDLRNEPPGFATSDLTVASEDIRVTIDFLKTLKLGFVVRVRRLGVEVQVAIALFVLAVAAALLVLVARDYTGWILAGFLGAAALLILRGLLGRSSRRDR